MINVKNIVTSFDFARKGSKIKLFLDDEREPFDITWMGIYQELYDTKGTFVIVRSFAEFVDIIHRTGIPDTISFDHDLGESLDGKDCLNWLVDNCLDHDIAPPNLMLVHSKNPVGRDNLESLIEQFNKYNMERCKDDSDYFIRNYSVITTK